MSNPLFLPPQTATATQRTTDSTSTSLQASAFERSMTLIEKVEHNYGGGLASKYDGDDDLIEVDADLTGDVAILVKRRHAIAAHIKELDKEKAAIDKLMKEIIAEHDGFTIHGAPAVTFKASTRVTVDQGMVRSLFPEGVAGSEPFYTTTEVRSINYPDVSF